MEPINQEKRETNKGFTLIEVLVAVALLSLMLGPILSSFVSVASVNSTSRKRLSATTVAESLMESVKSFELKEVAKQCVFPDQGFNLLAGDLETGSGFSGSAYELTRNATGLFVLRETGYSVTRNGSSYVFNANAQMTYYYLVTDIPMAGANYDAIITYKLDSTKSNLTYVDSDGNTVSVNSTLESFSVRALNYYDVTIEVYKSAEGEVNARLAEYVGEKALATLTGTKPDYD